MHAHNADKSAADQESAAAHVDGQLTALQRENGDDKEEQEVAETNGTPASEPSEVLHAEESTDAAVATADESQEADSSVQSIPSATTDEETEPESLKQPVQAPAPKASPKPAAPAGPPKPALPKTWAQLISGNKGAAAASGTAAPAPTSTAAKPNQASQAPAPASTASSQAPASSSLAAPPPAREPSPAEGSQDSQGGWQTAGTDHNRKQSRSLVQPPAADTGKIRAYVKNVYATVDANELKTHLSKFGELAYFDVSRAKVSGPTIRDLRNSMLTTVQNSAFVEFNTRAGFEAAVAANPHKLGNDNIYVEERRIMQHPGMSQRGSFRGGPNRPFEQRGRGNFGGGRARGGNVTPRGGRPAAPQAAA